MNLLRVQINTASAAEISDLYDIGRRRAQQIVDYRVANGPFHGPTDLAKIPEITLKLALFLSPHIDWRLHEEPAPPKQRSWSDVLLWLVVLLCVLLAILLLSVPVANAVLQGESIEPIKIVVAISGIGALFCFGGYAAFRLGVALTRRRERAQQLARAALASMAIALFVGVPCLLGSAAFWWYSVGVAQNSSDSGQPLLTPSMGGFALLLLYLLMTPQIIVWWRPQLAESRWLARLFDSTFLLAGLALLWELRLQNEGWPFWLLLLAALAGGLMVFIAILAIKRGESFFRTSLDFLDARRRIQETITAGQWRYWISTHLPDPAQQKAVQAALNEMHRASTRQTILRTLVMGVGWWLLLTALGSIVELYAQDAWNTWVK